MGAERSHTVGRVAGQSTAGEAFAVPVSRWLAQRQMLQDAGFLGLLVVVPALLYVSQIGFYADDWMVLGVLTGAGDQSFGGLFQALYDESVIMRQRPVQMLAMVSLYSLFGTQPLGYQLANTAVLVMSAALFYLVLRELGQSRLLSVALAAVYALLPQYCTDRFWVAAFVAALPSLALYFLSLYATLRAVRERSGGYWGWGLLGLLCLLGSGLAYEVALPLVLLTPLLLWYRECQLDLGQRARYRSARWRRLALLVVGNFAVVALVIGFKLLTTIRLGITISPALHAQILVTGMLWDNYGIFGVGLPYAAWWLLRPAADWAVVALGGALGLAVFGYLASLAADRAAPLPDKAGWLRLTALGVVASLLSYAVFFNTPVVFGNPGMMNRTAIAAAIGVALAFVGAGGWASSWLASEWLRRRAFCLLVALLCLCSVIVDMRVSSWWIASWRQQTAILADIHEQLPAPPPNSVLLLDQACPSVGPVVVFEVRDELGGALRTTYRDPSLRADIVEPGLVIGEDAIVNPSEYMGDVSFIRYPYGENLLLYNADQRAIYRLTDAQDARSYFQLFDRSFEAACSKGFRWRE